MGNSGHSPQGMPAAKVLHYPTQPWWLRFNSFYSLETLWRIRIGNLPKIIICVVTKFRIQFSLSLTLSPHNLKMVTYLQTSASQAVMLHVEGQIKSPSSNSPLISPHTELKTVATAFNAPLFTCCSHPSSSSNISSICLSVSLQTDKRLSNISSISVSVSL